MLPDPGTAPRGRREAPSRGFALDPVIVRGVALAVLLGAAGIVSAALIQGGNVPMLAMGLIVAAFAMDLFRLVEPRDDT